MNQPLQVLLLEDRAVDAELMMIELRREGIECTVRRVWTESDFAAGLKESPDLILADYSLPGYDGLAALELARRECPEVPFVFVTGTLGEEVAIEALKHGATDYVLKQRVSRLGSAVHRALREVTERRMRLDAERSFQELAEALPQLVWTCGPDGQVDFLGRQWLEYTGASVEEALGMGWLEWMHPDDRLRLESIRTSSASIEAAFQGDFRLRRHDGEYRWFDIRAVPIRSAKGTVIRWVGSNTDVHEERRIREALRESEERFRNLFDQATDGILLAAENGTGEISMVNQRMADMFGFTEIELRELGLGAICPPPDSRILQSALRGRAKGQLRMIPELSLRRKDGSGLIVEVNAAFVGVDDRNLIMGIFRDVTENRALRTELYRSQKMESLAQLAGGIAHDFKNLLTVVMAHAQLANYQLDPSDQLAPTLQSIDEAARKAAELADRMLVFSRRKEIEPQLLEANQIVEELIRLFRPTMPEKVRIETSLARIPLYVSIDRSRFEQALMNLILNAKDAMPGGGSIRIRTMRLELDERDIQLHPALQSGEHVQMEVEDSGHGVPAENLERIFEPFFTTKPPGKGTGLGLATAYRIIRDAGGLLTVTSEVGRGSLFRIRLPLAEGTPAEVSARQEALPRGTEGLLVVDDDPGVLKILSTNLRHLGYTVHQACHAADALVREAQFGRIDLLITDLVMPGLSGRELAERLSASQPEMKVLYISGYTEDAAGLDPAGSETPFRFLRKPFSIEALARTVREILDQPNRSMPGP